MCKFHIIMMHASGNISFERSIYFWRWRPFCAILCIIYAKKLCLKWLMYSHSNAIVGFWEWFIYFKIIWLEVCYLRSLLRLSRLISSESSFVFDSLTLYSSSVSSPIPLIILVILLWTPSRLSMSFWLCGRRACTQYSKCDLTSLLCKAMM